MIELIDVSKRFKQVEAVNSLSMRVNRGEIYGFLGPNGAGKTTTLKMIAGTLKPSSGRIIINGRDVDRNPEAAKQELGFIPDRPFLYEKLTGFEFLQFMAGLYKVNHDSFSSRSRELLNLFELSSWEHELVESYSHGMKQRLIMSAAMLHRPKALIVDEPMVGLDPRGARLLKKIFRQLRLNGVSILISTHTLSIAADICDRIGIIHKGRLFTEGTVEELKSQAGGSKHLEEAFLKLTGGNEEQVLTDFFKSEAKG
ncbi:MAG: ABC transporter ATP-binding protein [Deltaproteobacteria bacterium]|nr:ABC transporter ATP-binding protein [Deltaproteobacteria bacterium]MBW2051678.1 ABC transporter ATP-binding protein [Deltaproteobacteria bacterium]MBW2140200.1 ABC transporter ATP-binding protein [Deltaproteobacteria bacterium]MBW2323912.1 ABC transporter ATP-binding protein [Deltaproteobacteria bacterium]